MSGCMLIIHCSHGVRKYVICLLPNSEFINTPWSAVPIFSVHHGDNGFLSWSLRLNVFQSLVSLSCSGRTGSSRNYRVSRVETESAHFNITETKGKSKLPKGPLNTRIQIWLVTANASQIYQNRNGVIFHF